MTCLTAGLLSIAMGLFSKYPLAMLAMPFTWSITNGIGAGCITYAAIKLLNGRGGQVHWMVYLASAAFVLYFVLPGLEKAWR